MKVLDYDVIIHVVDQMYKTKWLSEETMTTWEETQDNEKRWPKCQTFFETAYIARKRYINTNKITAADLNMYLVAIDAKSAQENKECNKHIQQAH